MIDNQYDDNKAITINGVDYYGWEIQSGGILAEPAAAGGWKIKICKKKDCLAEIK